MKVSLLIATVLCFAFVPNAHASGDYAVVGAGCTVAPGSAAYTFTGAGAVTFSGTATGYITLYCPMTFAIDQPTSVEVQGADNSSSGYVAVYYYKTNAGTGGYSYISSVSTLDHADSGAYYRDASISDTYDSYQYRYFLQITIYRSSSAATEVFLGASVY
jgi:hypothetical protein